MDTDVSHEAEKRFTAIEARLDALEGGAADTTDTSGDVLFDTGEDE